MKILIAGGAGFIGSNSVDYFLKKGHTVVVVDNLYSGNYDNIKSHVDNGSIEYFKESVCDIDKLKDIFLKHDFDLCVNFAALVSVVESAENVELTEEINTKGLINLLKLSGENGVKAFVHASSAAIYGDNPVLPKIETMRPEPKSPYGISKLTGEYYNSYYASIYGFSGINFRFFNVFGPRQNPNSAYAAAVPIFIRRALNNQTITIYGDGTQTRDFVFVEDLISAIDCVVSSGKVNDIINVGYGESISINDLVKMIIELTGSKSIIEYKPARGMEVLHSYSSVDKLKSYGWSPGSGFINGINRTIEWMKTV